MRAFDRQKIDTICNRIVDALDRLGCGYTRKDGTRQRVVIRRRLLTETGSTLLLELDTERLPRGVKAGRLVSLETLHHLTAVVHHPVKVLNTTGVTYAVLLAGPLASRAKLPKKADLADALLQHPGDPLTFPVGEGERGPLWETLRGHYLVGGETGSGKTTWVLSTSLALALTNSPSDLNVVLIDPKGVDLLPLAGLPHLTRPVAVSLEEATQAVGDLVGEIEARRGMFARSLARDLGAYNNRAAERLPALLIIVDEVTTLALSAGLRSSLYRNLITLASMGRSFGLYLILATQNPKAEVLNTLIRGNLAGRIAFRVTTPAHSRVILGVSGAEKLPANTPGRMLTRVGSGGLVQLQGYVVAPDVWAALARDNQPAPDPLGQLSEQERAMVHYALEHLGGRFPQKQVMAAGWSRRQYRRAVDRLKARGLLYHDEEEHNALKLSPDLALLGEDVKPENGEKP